MYIIVFVMTVIGLFVMVILLELPEPNTAELVYAQDDAGDFVWTGAYA